MLLRKAGSATRYNVSMTTIQIARYIVVALGVLALTAMAWHSYLQSANAQVNIMTYSDTLSSSAPGALSNHTLRFVPQTTIPPNSRLELNPPAGFSIIATSSFAARNVELLVNGTPRPATSTTLSGYDQVAIDTGAPGQVRYTLDPALPAIGSGATVEFRVGNHTSSSTQPVTSTSTVSVGTTTATTTVTTTTPGDSPGIQNANTTGTHAVGLRIYDSADDLLARAGFLISLVAQVTLGPVDTRLQTPPELFNGAPSGDVSGMVSSVEITVETDRFASCRYARQSGISYSDMSNTFDRTDFWVIHTFTEEVENEEEYEYYVRCIDLEGNVNEEDYVIEFRIAAEPTGEPSEDGDLEGGGSGAVDEGSPDADEGGSTGPGAGDTPTEDDPAPSSGGGGGGGGSGSSGSGGSGSGGGFENEDAPFESGDARIIINGLSYPNSMVGVLVDGNEYDSTTAGNDGRYSITIDGIARGVYTFGVYGVDDNDTRSSTFSTSFTVSGARTSSLSNINVPPSIMVDPDPVDPGDPLTLSGYALPDAEITIEHEREGSGPSQKTFTATSDQDGFWSYDVDTSGLSSGPHRVRARAEQADGTRTDFSQYTRYGVGDAVSDTMTADLNQDGQVNLVDFSILLFWWDTDGGDSSPTADINRDGTVSLVDFSILLFNWTG